jgi:hypothetical protein
MAKRMPMIPMTTSVSMSVIPTRRVLMKHAFVDNQIVDRRSPTYITDVLRALIGQAR